MLDASVVAKRGARVQTWDGLFGEVLYVTAAGWYGIRLAGERGVFEWQRSQFTVVP